MSTPVTILDGPFMGMKGTVVRQQGAQYLVAVNVFGRTVDVTLDGKTLGFPGATLDVLEGEVLEAISRRLRVRLSYFWPEEAARTPPRSDAEVLQAYEAFSAGLLAEEEALQVEALKRFRAEFGTLDISARDAKWTAERDQWTQWRDEAKRLTDDIEARLYGTLTQDERFARAAAGHTLRDRVMQRRLLDAFAAPLPPEPRNLELEAAIARSPDDDAPWLVYGDWLSAQGDPRGELVALQAAGEARQTSEAALRQRLRPRLLGPLAGLTKLDETWHLGFLTSLRLEADRTAEAAGLNVAQVVDAALRLPSARFLRTLEIALPSAHEEGMAERLHAVLAAHGPRPLLRSLRLETNTSEEMLSWTSAGELSGLRAVFPGLALLDVHAGSFTAEDFDFPTLKTLRLRTCGLTEANVAALAAGDFPVLEELELWVGGSNYGVRVGPDHLVALLTSPRLPKLKTLGLCNNDFTDLLVNAVLGSPLLPRLEELTLSMGTLSEVGARRLIDAAPAFRHLKAIDVDDNYLPDETLAELQRALPQVTSDGQRTPEEYDGQLHRYASVGE